MRPAEHNYTVEGITPLGVVQQLAGEAPPRLDQHVERVLCGGSPRDYRGEVGLEEGPEADGRDPQVDVLACLDLQRRWEVGLHLDRARVVADARAREMVAEDPVSDDDGHALQEKHGCRDRRADVEIDAGEGVVGGEVLPDRIQGLGVSGGRVRMSRRSGGNRRTRRRQSSDAPCRSLLTK
jgi:hypothetical protein